ncbi:hypothetical protein RND71_021388 [Anisodus tanguticus]|uniref:Uncharacterized protein n=1 Tax=Anisodus tanguticus TaxID=243964 RepID=A0AAE1RV32_9SOLA|nr:hypothetical protein RND71_021388 [Anisodus tanguticus]
MEITLNLIVYSHSIGGFSSPRIHQVCQNILKRKQIIKKDGTNLGVNKNDERELTPKISINRDSNAITGLPVGNPQIKKLKKQKGKIRRERKRRGSNSKIDLNRRPRNNRRLNLCVAS